MEVVIISGLSGAGKSQAAKALEDLGYYCIDNMPPGLIKNFVELTSKLTNEVKKAAFIIDVRGGVLLHEFNESLTYLKEQKIPHKILFLEASDEILLRRYSETRRNHPLASEGSTINGIKKEKQLLEEVRKLANSTIDTSQMKPADLYREIKEMFMAGKSIENFTVNVCSFGYKNGLPLSSDLVFDVRFVPNPFYIPEMRELTGKDEAVKKYVLKQTATKEFIKMIYKMIEKLIPFYINEGKYNLNIAFGCTGGQHRSVAIAEEMARKLDKDRIVTLYHRDV